MRHTPFFAHLPISLLLILVAVFGAGGCASSEGPPLLTLDASIYPQAFDAAVEAARDEGMPADLRDRRAGVIDTFPRISSSLLEPWGHDNADFQQALENTLSFQRRRARFEFSPVGFQPGQGAAPGALAGPQLFGVEEPQPDLTQFSGEVELRVWVYVERAYTPGLRPGTWSRSTTTITEQVAPEGINGQPTGTYWVPVTRDTAAERRLLAAVAAELTPPPLE